MMADPTSNPDNDAFDNIASQDPLFGLLPRKVKGDQVREAIMEHKLNPFTKRLYSSEYWTILSRRKTLSIFDRLDEFLQMFSENQIMIVDSETGTGKTTQIPQFVCYSDLPHTRGKIVACTQPRRLAAMSAARRVANEMDVSLGQQVGYSIRHEDMTDPDTTFLKYITDGTLLREVMNDPDLERYSTIILDEVHERTLATDILISLLKGIAKRRPDLKIVIMGARLDVVKFQGFFGDVAEGNTTHSSLVPLLKIPASIHPVEVIYTQKPQPDYFEAAIRTVLTIHCMEDPGDILLFLPSEEEVEEACSRIKTDAEMLHNSNPDAVGSLLCIPFYSSLPLKQQLRIFDVLPIGCLDGPPGRKVIVSTNIAETSLTIDGIVYVVDPGFSKQEVYDPRIRVESFLVSPISKVSAQYRAGHAGQTKPGKCFRLYTEKDFTSELEEQTYPEILRSSLANLVLTLVKLGVKDLLRFDYLDTPSSDTLLRALELLNYLGALDDNGNLTLLGTVMAEFPLDPQMAKTLILSPKFKCSEEMLTIAAMLSVPDVWIRPASQKQDADAAKAFFTVPDGDHLTLLLVYNHYQQNKHNKTWAIRNFLSGRRLAEAENIRARLQHIMELHSLELVSLQEPQQICHAVRQAFCSGYFMQVAHRSKETRKYLTVKENQVVTLHPSCGLDLDDLPEWVMFNEFIFTTSPYIKTVTSVKVKWLLKHAPSYFDLATFPEGETKQALLKVVSEKEKMERIYKNWGSNI